MFKLSEANIKLKVLNNYYSRQIIEFVVSNDIKGNLGIYYE